ncbi:MAG: hypothetical protein CBC25_00805 [Pelagibacteraceae bacterium TMED65]|nr:MAG: hypothetical protein CBC25_00805 [Pelagibacteraceae bacterium TMED65]|tara:strand:- start:1122 stop:2339 length:1218 start_codon:yes stop_codon:yes gene_type:complete
MQNNICNNCKSKNLKKVFSLGKLSFSGRFGKTLKENIPKDNLNLVICNSCKLVQLDRYFDPRYLYGKGYGYRTGINKTMTSHVKKTVQTAIKSVNIKSGDYVLDIASNDGTLLSFYPKNIKTVGIDPLINKYKNYYKQIDYKVSSFFQKNKILKLKLKKFKIITALSVFYDLRNPNDFLKDVKEILDDNGIFILEHADLYSIIKNNVFDTICHEHLSYFSSKVIVEMVKKNNLRVFKHEFNDINGGSSRYFIVHEKSKYKTQSSVKRVLSLESKNKIEKIETLQIFFKKILSICNELSKLIKKIKQKKQSIHGYGASTKGNILLQFCRLGKKEIDFIADRNPLKFNLYTPGTKIKIISENKSRKIQPNYYLVLPWHFKNEILVREKKALKNKVKFIFPLPKLKIF